MGVVTFVYLFLTLLGQYVIADFYIDYECNTPLLERAQLKATSSMPKRGPENAVLYGAH
jgi:hypothetical protein